MARGDGLLVTGDKELDKKLAGLTLKLQKKLTRQATRKAAKEIVLPAARANAPVDTGELEESLKVRAIKRSRNRIGHMVTVGDGLGVGDTFYAAALELGTKERTQKSTGKKVGAIEPHKFAFLRRAAYDNEGQVQAEFISDVNELIREEQAK
jgi:HK97 gp10 family phage protein